MTYQTSRLRLYKGIPGKSVLVFLKHRLNNSIQVNQVDMCNTKIIEELREKTKIANLSINDKNELIDEQNRAMTLLRKNLTFLKDESVQKDAEIAQLTSQLTNLTAQLSFMGLNNKCL